MSAQQGEAQKTCYFLDLNTPSERLEPCEYINRQFVEEGDPVEKAALFISSEDGRFMSGLWSVTPYKEFMPSYPYDEVFTVIEGRATLTSKDGTSHNLGPGDVFAIQKGWVGWWHVTEPLKKHFTISM